MNKHLVKSKLIKLLVLLVCGFLWINSGLADEADKTKAKSSDKKTNKAGSTPELKKLKPFSSIVLTGLGDLYIKQSSDEGLTVEADDNVLPLISVKVTDKTLYLNLKQAEKYSKAKIKYNLSIKELNKLDFNSPGKVVINDVLNTNSLTLFVDGFGEADIKINTSKLVARLGGGGKLVATGKAEDQAITINGAGEFYGSKLAGKSGIFVMSGSSIAKIGKMDSLDVTASDDAILKYCGSPSISKHLSNSALITALSKAECK